MKNAIEMRSERDTFKGDPLQINLGAPEEQGSEGKGTKEIGRRTREGVEGGQERGKTRVSPSLILQRF